MFARCDGEFADEFCHSIEVTIDEVSVPTVDCDFEWFPHS